MDITQHTLKYIHKRRGFSNADKEQAPEPAPEPITPAPACASYASPNIRIYCKYLLKNPDIVFNYLRNERAMIAQSKHMNAKNYNMCF